MLFKSFSIHNLVVEQLIHYFKLFIFIQIIKSFLNYDSYIMWKRELLSSWNCRSIQKQITIL
jgi:hypothetical protein